MLITLYKQDGAPTRVDKTNYITKIKDISGVKLKESESILKTKFRLRYSADVYSANYLYCQQTGRYYFIDDITMEIGKQLILHCTTDVLFTAKDGIKNSEAWVELAEADQDTGQAFLQNGYPFQINTDTQGLDFSNNPMGDTVNFLIIMQP